MTHDSKSIPKHAKRTSDELSPDELWKRDWKESSKQLGLLSQLLKSFHNEHEPKTVKERPDLQLLLRLLQRETAMYTNQQALLMSKAYEDTGSYPPKRLRTELFDENP